MKLSVVNLKIIFMKNVVSKICSGIVLSILFVMIFSMVSFAATKTFEQDPGGTKTFISGGKDGTINIPNPLGVSSFSQLLNRIINFLILIATPLVTLMILYAAFQIMTAAGDPAQFSKGRQTILYVTLGYLLLLVSKGIISVIESFLK